MRLSTSPGRDHEITSLRHEKASVRTAGADAQPNRSQTLRTSTHIRGARLVSINANIDAATVEQYADPASILERARCGRTLALHAVYVNTISPIVAHTPRISTRSGLRLKAPGYKRLQRGAMDVRSFAGCYWRLARQCLLHPRRATVRWTHTFN